MLKVINFYLDVIKSNFPNYNHLISELLEEEFKHLDSRKVLKSAKKIENLTRIIKIGNEDPDLIAKEGNFFKF